MSYYYSRRSTGPSNDTIKAVFGFILVVLVIAGIIWWHLNYKCVSTHYEWRTDCDVHRNSDGKRTGETCHERRVEVCDEWEPR